jgi:hypothetical protein
MKQPTAETALRALDALVGEWILEARPPGGEPWPGAVEPDSNGTTLARI